MNSIFSFRNFCRLMENNNIEKTSLSVVLFTIHGLLFWGRGKVPTNLYCNFFLLRYCKYVIAVTILHHIECDICFR